MAMIKSLFVVLVYMLNYALSNVQGCCIQLSLFNKFVQKANSNFPHSAYLRIEASKSNLDGAIMHTEINSLKVHNLFNDISNSAKSSLANVPCLSRYLILSSAALSALEFALKNRINMQSYIPLSPQRYLELWRYVTSSIYFGPLGISLFRNIFIFKAVSSSVELKLEELNNSATAFAQILVSNILISSIVSMYLGYGYISQSVSSSLVYLYSLLMPDEVL